MTKLVPCKHLDYDESKYGDTCKIETCAPEFPHVRYWARNEVWTAGGSPRNVQFCGKGHGRINAIFDCYEPGCMICYEPEAKGK